MVDVIKLNDEREIENLAQFFHKKWKVPISAYVESMTDALKSEKGIPSWFYVKDEKEIIAGLGVIENDFHKRADLTPNICAVYVKENYRNKGIARKLLDFAQKDLAKFGIDKVYLITSHTTFYEKCGFEFYGMIEENDGNLIRCYVNKQIN